MQGDRYSGWWPLLAWFQCTSLLKSPDQEKKNPFSSLTSSTRLQWAWHLVMQNQCTLFKNLALHKCQSEKQAYAVMKQNKEKKDLFIQRLWRRCTCCIQVRVIDWMKLAVFIAWILKPSAENTWFVCIYKLAQWSQFVDAQRGLTNTANDRSDQTELPLQIPIN